ncbi:lipopolysaccharide biosynthesis protein [Bradyrhizobium sp. AUGA SZCCT0222]|uniref:oligosaccharide flippase family protein n=1 Tax=Bradyrhizobium sp. AUGA SZCCT0222 TaxID=2807668 RepID=UPI001BAA88DF|nr:lipopolysaccharide biosynthesis protein [Bradyrhizobium sp. AUGA SZCCT0222]MBR1269810.1 lipopolysaccharide biosynthesis protein [Bradyrhizobium sp. AUGA SZCCT0222]
MFGSLFWKSVLAFAYRCSGAVVTFAFGVCFARMMSIEEYGVLVSLMTFGFIASTIGLVGQQLLVLREIPSLATRKDYTSIGSIVAKRVRVACLGSIAATAIALLIFVAAHGRGGVFGRWEYATSLLLILPLALIEMQSSVGRALGSVNLALMPKDVLWRLFIILFGGAFFVAYGHPVTAADVFVIATGILVVLIAIQQVHLRRLAQGHRLFTNAVKRSKDSVADVISTSGPFWVTSIASMLFATIDIVIVSVIVGPEAGGLYYAANRIALLLDFFLVTFCIPAAPLIARLFDEGRRTEITRIMSGGTLAAFIGVLGCVVVLALVGDIVLMAFGQHFVRAHGVLMVLAIGMLASTYFGVGSVALNMTGHQRAAMNIMVTTSVLGVAAMVGATWMFGIWGTAVVLVVVWVANRAWMAAHIYAAEGIDLTPTTMLITIGRRATRIVA